MRDRGALLAQAAHVGIDCGAGVAGATAALAGDGGLGRRWSGCRS